MEVGLNIVNEIGVDTFSLNSDIERLEQLLADMKKAEDTMNEEIMALCGMWRGTAQTAFLAQFTKDCNDLEEMRQFLIRYVEKLKIARDEYKNCDSEVAQILNSNDLGSPIIHIM